MFDLFKSELNRYRNYALVAAVVLLGFLIYMDGAKPIMANTFEQVTGYSLLVVVLSLAFAITQMVLHRRKSHWAFLVHRPMPVQHIFYAIAGAGVLLLLLVAMLPVLIMLLLNDLRSVDIVESRHYLFVLHIGLLVLFCYFVGVYTALNPSWISFLSVGLLYFVLVSDPVSASFNLMSDLICTVIIFYLAKQSFKVNLTLHFTGKREIFMATLVTHTLVIALLFVSQMLFYHLPLFIAGEHPDQYKKEQLDGFYAQLWQLENDELIELVVDENLYPSKATLKAQVLNAESVFVRAKFEALPSRGQIFHQDKSYALEDRANSTRWLFSHQEMLFIGKHRQTGEIVGYLGAKAFLAKDVALSQISQSERFAHVPAVDDDNIIRTSNTIYIVDFDDKYIEVKHQLNEGEYYLNSMFNKGGVAKLAYVSNKSLYIFDKSDFYQLNTYSEPQMEVKQHKAIAHLNYIIVYELVDGYLLNYNSSQYFGFDKPGVGLVLSKFDGTTTFLGEKAFKQYRPLPQFISYQDVIMSPLAFSLGFKTLEALSKSSLSPDYVTFAQRLSFDYPSSVYLYALTVWLVSALLTFYLGRKQQLDMGMLLYWQFIILMFSLGGLVSFLFMHRWKGIIWRAKVRQVSSPTITANTSNALS